MATAAQQLAANVRHFRTLRGLSQEKLAERADLSIEIVSKIERSKSNPALMTLLKIAQALCVPVHELLRHF